MDDRHRWNRFSLGLFRQSAFMADVTYQGQRARDQKNEQRDRNDEQGLAGWSGRKFRRTLNGRRLMTAALLQRRDFLVDLCLGARATWRIAVVRPRVAALTVLRYRRRFVFCVHAQLRLLRISSQQITPAARWRAAPRVCYEILQKHLAQKRAWPRSRTTNLR